MVNLLSSCNECERIRSLLVEIDEEYETPLADAYWDKNLASGVTIASYFFALFKEY
ncbi:hypothetical protein Q5O89_00455 [Peribacillus frigoritolerans]|nr:hypothetical protein [Peribacillus frigoritolerans]